MLRVFLSWSGKRSRGVAEALAHSLPRVIHQAKPWMSSSDISKGKRWSSEIGKTLEEHDVGIICVTPENYEAPWLIFEAGALSKSIGMARVCPLLLGMSPSELRGPLREFQATVVDKKDMLRLFASLNALIGPDRVSREVLEDTYSRFWPDLEKALQRASEMEIPGTSSSVQSVVGALSKHGLPEPVMGSQTYFQSGFESHGLYSTLADVAESRLLIFGRKNRKLFDKEHMDFLGVLPKKLKNGYDFRILFLDPEAPDYVLLAAHQDDDLRPQLHSSINRCRTALESVGLDPAVHCRKYRIHRPFSMMVADDAVIHSTIHLDDIGRAKKLTKAPFSVINSTSALGEELIQEFETQWIAAVSIG